MPPSKTSLTTSLPLLGVYLLLMILLGALFFYFRRRIRTKEKADTLPPDDEQDVEQQQAQQPRRRQARGALDRMRRDVEDRKEPAADGAASDAEEDDGEDEVGFANKKEKHRAEKAAVKAARAEQRRHDDEAASAKKRKEDSRAEAYRKKEEEREAAERARAEEAKKKADDEQARQLDEFEQWKNSMEVSSEGSVLAEETAHSEEDLLEKFMNYVIKHKVVFIDDLSSYFHLKSADVIIRLRSLEDAGKLTGILDDRGKYIYITVDELEAVVKFISRRGRVTIYDVVNESNKLIDMTGSENDNEGVKDIVLDDEDTNTNAST